MKSKFAPLAWSVVAVAGVSYVACGTALAQDTERVQAANLEGEVVWYTAMAQSVAQEAANAFQEAYPEIKVSILRLASNQLATRFTTEADNGVHTADIYDAGTPIVQQTKPELFKDIASVDLPNVSQMDERGVQEKYIAYFLSTAILGYNSNALSPETAPMQWEDLLAPELKGRIAMNDPRASDVWMAWANVMYDLYGPDYLSSLREQDPQMFDSGVPAAQQTAAGRFDIAVPITQSHVVQLVADGAPITVVGATSGELEPTFGFERLISLPVDAPHPNAAELFLNWFLSAEAQEIACEQAYISYNNEAEGCQKVPQNLVKADFAIPEERRAEILDLLGLE